MPKNEISVINQTSLVNPGDRAEAYITKTGRQVLKVSKNNGNDKYSATRYPTTGRIVETKSTNTR